MVREKIKASQIANRLMDGFTGKVELSPTQVKIGIYLLNQSIGTPPQQVESEVNVNISTVKAQVQALVARAGEDRARMVLESLAPGLLTLLPNSQSEDVIEGELVGEEV